MSDINKHSGKNNAIHITSIFENIPSQLSMTTDSSTNRYKFKSVIPRKKGYAEFEAPISWLEKAGLIYKVLINNRPKMPLKSFCKQNLFKLFYFDHGLLAVALKLPVESLILQDYLLSIQ